METDIKPVVKNFNKAAYILFTIAGLCFLFVKDREQAIIFLGLALVFDPFDPKISFNKRPLYQKLWLIIHLFVTLGLFIIMILKK